MKPKVKNKFNDLQKKINKFSKDICIPKNLKEEKVNINTDLNIVKYNSKTKIIKKKHILSHDFLKNDPIKTKRYLLLPTNKQKQIFNNWFDAYIEMYNHIISKIKNKFREELQKKPGLKLVDLKFNSTIGQLKKEVSVQKNLLKEKYKINMHILDYAIVDAVAMFKSKISNLKNGHIKKSRLRYLKKTKSNKIFKIENQLCNSTSFCPTIIGENLKTKPDINFKEKIKIVGIVQYDLKKDKYYLLVREHIINKTEDELKKDNIFNEDNQILDEIIKTSKKYLNLMKKIGKHSETSAVDKLNKEINLSKRKKQNNKKNNKKQFLNQKTENKNPLAIDPGIRTLFTGISGDHIIEIGKNISEKIKRKIKYMDKIKNHKSIKEIIKERKIKKTEEKLKNKINDYHWKIINYMTQNYNHIIFGNFSTKNMGENKIGKIIKRMGNNIRLYKFKEKLKYKCFLNGIKYKEIDEYCTSKCCSYCGNFKKDLGGNKIYECINCGKTINRDINGARNIYMKGIK